VAAFDAAAAAAAGAVLAFTVFDAATLAMSMDERRVTRGRG
jgi:hypothetical protein